MSECLHSPVSPLSYENGLTRIDSACRTRKCKCTQQIWFKMCPVDDEVFWNTKTQYDLNAISLNDFFIKNKER